MRIFDRVHSNGILYAGIFLIFFQINLQGQEYQEYLKSYSLEDGLSNMYINGIGHDKEGFLWVVTASKIDRFDGYSFTPYTGYTENKFKTKIRHDAEKNFWIYVISDSHHSLLLKKVDSFTKFNFQNKKLISISAKLDSLIKSKDFFLPIINNSEKEQWLTDDQGGLWSISEEGAEKKFQIPINSPIEMVSGNENFLWVAVQNQIWKLNRKNKNRIKKSVMPNRLLALGVTNQQLWGATLDSTNQKIDLWDFDQDLNFSSIELQKNGQPLALGTPRDEHSLIYRTSSGIWLINVDGETNLFTSNGNYLDALHSLKLKGALDIRAIYEYNDHLWIPSTHGLFKFRISEKKFNILFDPIEPLMDIRGIAANKEEEVYFVYENLYKIKHGDRIPKRASDETFGLSLLGHGEKILSGSGYSESSIIQDYDTRTGEVISFPKAKSDGTSTAMLKSTQSGDFWIGYNNGLAVLDTINKEIIPFQKENQFKAILDAQVNQLLNTGDSIWMATDEGIFLMQESQGIIGHFNTINSDLPSNNIQFIHQDKEKILWLGTVDQGLVRWDRTLADQKAKNQFEQFTSMDGLPNNTIHAIYEDSKQRLWLTSNFGLICFDKKTRAIISYFKEDGLPHNEFNKFSHHRGPDSTLYFGGLGGIISFNPNAIDVSFSLGSNLALTRYLVQGKNQIELEDRTKLFDQSGKIELFPGDKFLELEFALLDFDIPENHRYEYLIEGYNSSWIKTRNNYIRITSLPYGKYKIRIKGGNIKTGWSKEELSIPIHIIKPFYLKSWFFFLLALLGISFIVGVFYFRLLFLQRERRLLTKKVKERTIQIERQTQKLRDLDRLKTNFFNNVTHEIRTPLSLILGPASELKKAENLREEEKNNIDRILLNTTKLQTLLDELLELDKLGDQKNDAELSPIKVADFFAEILFRLQPFADKHKVMLSGSYEDGGPGQLMLDVHKLERILDNLLINAIKFTLPGGKVDLSAFWKENQLELIVEDTGIGISEKDIAQIFDRYFQVNQIHSTIGEGGFGLGLALCKEYTDLMGGEIQVTSEPGVGTRFLIQIPTEKVRNNEISLISRELKPTLKTASFQSPEIPVPLNRSFKEHLLIVEDNDGLTKYLNEILSGDYLVHTAYNGASALEILKSHKIDLILSDVMMPVMNGFELLKRVNLQFPEQRIPFLFLTALSDSNHRLSAFRLGVDDFIKKPFIPEELLHRIKILLENYKVRKMTKKEFPIISEDQQWVLELEKICYAEVHDPEFTTLKLAKILNISERSLSTKVKLHIGMSPGQYIREVRLNLAKRMIENREFSRVSEIAYAVGFKKVSYFSQIFKKRFGRLPSEMLK